MRRLLDMFKIVHRYPEPQRPIPSLAELMREDPEGSAMERAPDAPSLQMMWDAVERIRHAIVVDQVAATSDPGVVSEWLRKAQDQSRVASPPRPMMVLSAS